MSGVGEPYECAVCHETFVKTITDEEALAEQAAIWQPRPGESSLVCDGCFRQVLAWAATEHPEFLKGMLR